MKFTAINSFQAWEITKEGITPYNLEEKMKVYLLNNPTETGIKPIREAVKQFRKDNLITIDTYNFFTKTDINTFIEIFL